MIPIHFEKVSSHAQTPRRSTDGSIGYDAFACLIETDPGTREDRPRTYQVFHRGAEDPVTEEYNPDSGIRLEPGARALIPIGVKIELPLGVECDVCAKSGRAWNEGFSLVNGIGLLDPDFAGEIHAIIVNLSGVHQKIRHGEKVVQLKFQKYEDVEFKEARVLAKQSRSGGLGSTGL